ncbi:hypothetical protein ACH0C8_15580, partial [Acetobacter lovaniensis]|uniref:hypothetical protein n=1 Tax=Acetobacter lovaniensis TaxID=104100 RepID=UPI0037701A2F
YKGFKLEIRNLFTIYHWFVRFNEQDESNPRVYAEGIVKLDTSMSKEEPWEEAGRQAIAAADELALNFDYDGERARQLAKAMTIKK